MSKEHKTRFAPSPTGQMHLGNVRTAIFNYLLARKLEGSFLLRIEDTDRERSKPEYYTGIKEDLAWLGLQWDECALQTERFAIYEEYYAQLLREELAYPCFCTEQELKISRKTQLAAGRPPRYAGTCRELSQAKIQEKIAAGIAPTLRFKIPNNIYIEFVDLIKGPQRFFSNDIGDFIIRRADGSAQFMFCNAIDDANMGVTHAIRGDDHLTNTPRQIMLLNALKLRVPDYGHFAMINGHDGAPLSKRNGSATVAALKEEGYQAIAINNYLARLGHYYADNELLELPLLAQKFSLENVSVSPARHDVEHLIYWQKKAMYNLSNEALSRILLTSNIIPLSYDLNKLQRVIDVVKENLVMPHDALKWLQVFDNRDLIFSSANKLLISNTGSGYFKAALDILNNNSVNSYTEFLQQLTRATGLKGKNLFLPLRVALTDASDGPELSKIWDKLGKAYFLNRIKSVLDNYENL